MKSKITFSLISFLFSGLLSHAQVEFEEHVVIDPALYVQSPNSVTSADLDGDGDMDVLTSSYFGNRLVWLENLDGAGNDVTLHTISSTIQSPWGVYTADLDSDGDLDVLAASLAGNSVTWYENTDGNGTFVLKQSKYAYQANIVMAADMDNDADLDLVWSSKGEGTIKWIRNSDGLGNFDTTFNVEDNVSTIMSIYPADMDGDGDKDIVSCYMIDASSQGVTWYKNIGFGSFGSRILISNAVSNVNSVYAGDLDGDGDMDLVSASGGDDKIAWYKNLDGIGTFGTQQVLSLTADAAAVVRIADVDGDNDKDVIFGSNNDKTIGWFENMDGMGNFSSETFIAPHSGDIRDIYFSDMDADGDLDFLTATNIDNNIKLFKNTDGTGNFTSNNILTKHIDGGRIVVADDLDGDGDKDIIAASYWDDKISWFKNVDGQGNFYNSQTIISATINGASSVFVGDVDGDGFKDVLATSYLDNTVVWFKNTDGLGTLSDPQLVDNNLINSSRVYLSDIDNDGDMDVFALGRTKIAWYENLNGLGGFSSQQSIDNISNFSMKDMSFGDLDGDGDLDISVAGTYGLMRYLNLNGQGTFGTRQLINGTTNYQSVSTKITDIDGDGDNDIVYIGNTDSTGSSSYLGWSKNLNGLGSFGSLQIISTILSYPKSVIVADFDNDGDMDVASSAEGNGGVIAWYENTDGQGAFANTQQIISQTSNSPYDIFAVDIDNNSTVDIVSISNFDDKISLHKNLGIPTSNSISGTVRFDLLGDGCTVTDALVSGILLIATDNTTTNATFSQENGQFQIYTTQEGTVTTQVTSQLPTHYAANPASFQSNFTGFGNSDAVNFCIAPIAVINDLTVSFYPFINPRPGFMAGYRIVYKNTGTTQLNGSVSFTFDNSKLNFLNATETIASQTSNTLTFDFTGLNPFETKTIDLRFNVFTPPTTNIGDVLISSATINPAAGDFTPEDNVFQYRQVVVGSYDPNDITCLEGDQVLIEDADNYLHYLIRFQNTGTADAINVRVDNILDDKLDWTTMQLESLSHSGQVTIRNGSEVSFVFNNINLPNSTNDEPNSHGFIAYKIKPKDNVVVGNIINETAAIYFDFNPPIVTNTTSTEFFETLSVVDFEVDKVSVYPNPTNGILNIVSNVSIETIDLFNHLGQLVLSVKDTSSIDVSSFSQGVYLMTLKDESGTTFTKRIIKK